MPTFHGVDGLTGSRVQISFNGRLLVVRSIDENRNSEYVYLNHVDSILHESNGDIWSVKLLVGGSTAVWVEMPPEEAVSYLKELVRHIRDCLGLETDRGVPNRLS